MTTFTFAGTSSTTIPEIEVLRVRRPLVARRRDDYVEVSGRPGFWLFEEEPGARRITLELQILGDSFEARRAAVIALADLLDQPGISKLVVDDEPDRFHRCRLASDPDPEEWLSHTGAFSVDLVAQPYSEAETISDETFTITSSTPATFEAPDKVEGLPIVTVRANGGTITGFSLTVNGETLTYGDTLSAGQTVTISTLAYVVTDGAPSSIADALEGIFNPAALDMASVSGDFPYVVPGTNSVALVRAGGSSTSATVEISWRRRSR
jgi:predicted phage tail component-like protein